MKGSWQNISDLHKLCKRSIHVSYIQCISVTKRKFEEGGGLELKGKLLNLNLTIKQMQDYCKHQKLTGMQLMQECIQHKHQYRKTKVRTQCYCEKTNFKS